MHYLIFYGNYILIGWLITILLLEQIKKRFYVPTTIISGSLHRWMKNISFGFINRLLGPILATPIIIWASELNLLHKPEWMVGVPILIINIIILDLSNYWFHRLCHKIPFLWKFHRIHHLDSAIDTTTGLRIHFGELIFLNIFRILPIIVFSITFLITHKPQPCSAAFVA